MFVMMADWSGLFMNAATASGWVNHASTPANSAQPKIDRNGGIRLRDRITSRINGRRLIGPMLNSDASVACEAVGSKVVEACGPVRPRIANSTIAMTTAGPDVQII